MSLGLFPKGTIKNLQMKFTLNSELGNEYQELLGDIKWIFSAQDTGITDKDKDKDDNKTETEIKPPKTGDEGIPPWIIILFAVSAVILIILIFLYIKKYKKSEDNKD